MAVALAQSVVFATGTTGAVATLGSTPTPGNIVVAAGATSATIGNDSWTTPATGWTLLNSINSGNATGSLATYARVVAASESASYTYAVSGATFTDLTICEISGGASTIALAIPTANHNMSGRVSAVTGATPTLTPTAGRSAIALGFCYFGGVTSAQSTNNGFTIHVNPDNEAAEADLAIASTTGSYTTTFLWTTAHGNAEALVIVRAIANNGFFNLL